MVDVEFVTPQRWDVALERIGVDEAQASSSRPAPATMLNRKPARVSVCLSLVQVRPPQLSSVLAVRSRELDTACLERGSARRALILPTRPPALPLSVVELAQHLHSSHAFSAAAPSAASSSAAASLHRQHPRLLDFVMRAADDY